MGAGGTLAILPVKSFANAKQRLESQLSPPLRRALARAMLGDVLSALGACPRLSATVVVTQEPDAVTVARDFGATVLGDPQEQGQSAAASIGIAYALAEGYERALLVPGDCPTLNTPELVELLGATAAVVIVPDRHGTGTNALLLSPPDVITPSFGPDSFARHEAAAQATGVACEVRRLPSLLLDVDTPDDLAAVRRALGAGPSLTGALLG